jgi:hypothetical protein
VLHIEQIPHVRHNWIRTLSRFGEFRFVKGTRTAFEIRKEAWGMTASFHNPVYISAL